MDSPVVGGTVAALFELAIAAEREAAEFYRGLAKKFSHLAEASDLWKEMAKDEAAHIARLEEVRASLTPEQLRAPVEGEILLKAKATPFSARHLLAQVETLEDAYQFAHSLEHSEVNTIFEFILVEFVDQDTQREFISSQLRGHIARLTESSIAVKGAGWRSEIASRD